MTEQHPTPLLALRRSRRPIVVGSVLVALLAALILVSLMLGNTNYSFGEVVRALMGENVPGASYTVAELRAPRVGMAIVAGLAFGMSGAILQSLLRNELASPDIIGVSASATAVAVYAIVVLHASQATVSGLALAGSIAITFTIYVVSIKGGRFTGTRLVLTGIATAAVCQSTTTYMLSRAASWDLQGAMRWLNGSLNNASWDDVAPVAIVVALTFPLILSQLQALRLLEMGDDLAAGRGVNVTATRAVLLTCSVTLVAFATAACGPIAFVAFLSGPIARRLVRNTSSGVITAGMIGALIVLVSDFIGQHAFGARYPVGVITGAIGAPYLVLLLIRTNRQGHQ